MTVKIQQQIQQFIQGKQGWIATASKDGMPNIAIKGSLRLLDDEHLMFADLFNMKTQRNLAENSQVAVMVFEELTRQGYMFKGHAETITEGALYDQVVEMIKQLQRPLPKPFAAVRIGIEAIFNQSLGPDVGKQIA